jgi:glycine/sarcosine N-methyltransferase
VCPRRVTGDMAIYRHLCRRDSRSRTLECSMAEDDPTRFYDKLADYYDQMFGSWEATIVRQAAVLSTILHRECVDSRPVRVLDCACGIGTQSLGLAIEGFDVNACDISSRAVQRARSEASKRRLKISFSVANIMDLKEVSGSNFDAVICIDNALPHLESDEQLLLAAQQVRAKLRDGGSFIGSVRDYDRLIPERPLAQGPSFFSDDGRRRIVFQVWDWLDDRRNRFHLYITRSAESEWHTFHFTTLYRAVLRNELGDILAQAGFTDIRWLFPADSGFYQPIFVAKA